MGKGEAAAHFQNLRGFTAIVMPMVYARLYGLGLRWGVPGLCFVLAAAMSGVGGLLFPYARPWVGGSRCCCCCPSSTQQEQ